MEDFVVVEFGLWRGVEVGAGRLGAVVGSGVVRRPRNEEREENGEAYGEEGRQVDNAGLQ